MFGQNFFRQNRPTFAVLNRRAENPYTDFDSFRVMQQKAVFEMSASCLARIQKAVQFNVIFPIAALCFGTDLRVLQGFHLFFDFLLKSDAHQPLFIFVPVASETTLLTIDKLRNSSQYQT